MCGGGDPQSIGSATLRSPHPHPQVGGSGIKATKREGRESGQKVPWVPGTDSRGCLREGLRVPSGLGEQVGGLYLTSCSH